MNDEPTPTTLEGITQVWVRSARNGDAGDFARLYEHIAPAVHTWASLRLRPNQAAMLDPGDLVQEVWLRAWRRIDDFDHERVPFRFREPGIGFLRLFSTGPTLRGLASVNGLQQVAVCMGDTWQVFARELRGWGSEQCGLFGSLTGLGGMAASLMARCGAAGTRGAHRAIVDWRHDLCSTSRM